MLITTIVIPLMLMMATADAAIYKGKPPEDPPLGALVAVSEQNCIRYSRKPRPPEHCGRCMALWDTSHLVIVGWEECDLAGRLISPPTTINPLTPLPTDPTPTRRVRKRPNKRSRKRRRILHPPPTTPLSPIPPVIGSSTK